MIVIYILNYRLKGVAIKQMNNVFTYIKINQFKYLLSMTVYMVFFFLPKLDA